MGGLLQRMNTAMMFAWIALLWEYILPLLALPLAKQHVDAIFDTATAKYSNHPRNFNFNATASYANEDVPGNIDTTTDHSGNNNAAAINDASNLPGNDKADINISTDKNVPARYNAAAVLFSF